MVVEPFGDFVSDEFVGFAVRQVVLRIDGFLNGFQIVEPLDAAVVAALFTAAFCGGLLRCGGFVGGGFGLFWLTTFKKELELGGINLLGLCAVKKLDDSIQLLLQELDPFGLGGVLRLQSGVLLFGCFDAGEGSIPYA